MYRGKLFKEIAQFFSLKYKFLSIIKNIESFLELLLVLVRGMKSFH